MKLQLGDKEIFDCDSVDVEFVDGTATKQSDEYLYVNPSMVKSISVKGIK